MSSLSRLKFSGQTNEKIVWRRSNGVNGKAPQAVVAVLQICGKKGPRNAVKTSELNSGEIAGQLGRKPPCWRIRSEEAGPLLIQYLAGVERLNAYLDTFSL